MQHAGTLRKRTKRPLVKVTGLGNVPYAEHDDDLLNGFSSNNYNTNGDTRIDLRWNSHGKNDYVKNSSRATRDPLFHMEEGTPPPNYNENSPPPTSNAGENFERNHDRPYLLSEGVYMRLRIIIFLGMLCFNVPWTWNKKTHRVDRWHPHLAKLWTLYWYFTTIQSTGLILYQCYCFTGIYSRDLDSYRGIFAYSLIIYWYACHLGYKTCIFLYEDRLRNYINQLQDFNQEYVDKYLMYADKNVEFSSARMIMKLSIPAAATQIPNSLFFFLVLPSAPYYLTSKINPAPWFALIPGALQDLTLVGQTILTYITISWIQIAHASSAEFWLREMHKDSASEYTSNSIRQPNVVISSYRALQLMCTNFNECMAPLCLPVWKFSVAFGFIPCGYLWIRSMNQVFIDEFPGILVYPFGAVNCFTMGFGCLAMAAEMYDIANSFIFSWSRTKEKTFRRVLMSCPTLKMKVGRYYFITASTTITFFQVITGYIIDCIITFP